jgi:hypothetical protein
MKKITCVLLLAFASLTAAWAQPEQSPSNAEKRKEKVEALKRSYYSEKLELTPAEAEKFWPIYNDYAKKESELKKAGKGEKGDKKKGEVPTFTEKEALAEIDRVSMNKKNHIDLEAQFLKDSMPVLGPNRTMRLAKLDTEFQRELVKRMKERKEGEKGPKK